MLAQRIVDIARGCINTPFRHQGRCPGRGLDCAGLAIHVAESVGFNPHDVRGYDTAPHKGLLRKAIESQTFLRPVTDLRGGDVLLLRIRHEPQHIAIFADDHLAGETIIHAYQTIGRVIEERYSSFWRARLIAAYRFCNE